MTTLQGLLVDLVPFDARFEAREHDWYNGEGVYFWAVGSRWIVTKSGLERDRAENREEEEREGRMRLRFGVQLKDGTPIGMISVNVWNPHQRTGMLSAIIGESAYWGGGYGTDALLLIIDYAFDWLDLRKVWLMTMALNARVIRQMEKVGFELEGRQRASTWVDTQWIDMLMYGMQRADWPGREAVIARIGLQARAPGSDKG